MADTTTREELKEYQFVGSNGFVFVVKATSLMEATKIARESM